MDTKKYAKLAAEHFSEITHYSELKPDKMEEVFLKYLEELYQTKVMALAVRVDYDRDNGDVWDEERYEDEMIKMNREVLGKFKELLAGTKEDLSN